jgi:hypothetical protein
VVGNSEVTSAAPRLKGHAGTLAPQRPLVTRSGSQPAARNICKMPLEHPAPASDSDRCYFGRRGAEPAVSPNNLKAHACWETADYLYNDYYYRVIFLIHCCCLFVTIINALLHASYHVPAAVAGLHLRPSMATVLKVYRGCSPHSFLSHLNTALSGHTVHYIRLDAAFLGAPRRNQVISFRELKVQCFV